MIRIVIRQFFFKVTKSHRFSSVGLKGKTVSFGRNCTRVKWSGFDKGWRVTFNSRGNSSEE